jgi:transcription-repair coupling factor (superfamily II helicase)
MELLFPDSYISGTSERMLLYRELDSIENAQQLEQFKAGLVDRFGKMPRETEELLEVVQLRWKAIELSMEKVVLKNKSMICYFVSDQQSKFYSSPDFSKIVQYIQKTGNGKMKELNNKLTLSFTNIPNVETADYLLKNISDFIKNN